MPNFAALECGHRNSDVGLFVEVEDDDHRRLSDCFYENDEVLAGDGILGGLQHHKHSTIRFPIDDIASNDFLLANHLYADEHVD